MIVSIYIYGDFDTDEAVDWAIKNCPSFDHFKVIELSWEEKKELDCWFRFDVMFNDEKDAMLFELRWA